MTTQTEENKKLVLDFYSKFLNERDITAIDKCVAPGFIEHSPAGTGGREGLRAIAENGFPEFRGFPGFRNTTQRRVEMKRIIAEGDLVAIHVHSRLTPGDRGYAQMAILRIENGLIAEHWSVYMEVPERSPNPNALF